MAGEGKVEQFGSTPGQRETFLPQPRKPAESKTSVWLLGLPLTGLLHTSPWGNCWATVLQPSNSLWMQPGVTLVSWQSWQNFTQKSKWKNSFLYFLTLHSTLISALKSFIDSWQLNGKLSCSCTERKDRFPNSCLISLSTWKRNRCKDLRKAFEHLVPSNNEFQFPLPETGITLGLFSQLSK